MSSSTCEKARSDFAQDGIDEWSGRAFAGTLDEFDALVDGGTGGNAAEPAELVNSEAECGENLRDRVWRVVAQSSWRFLNQAAIASAEPPLPVPLPGSDRLTLADHRSGSAEVRMRKKTRARREAGCRMRQHGPEKPPVAILVIFGFTVASMTEAAGAEKKFVPSYAPSFRRAGDDSRE